MTHFGSKRQNNKKNKADRILDFILTKSVGIILLFNKKSGNKKKKIATKVYEKVKEKGAKWNKEAVNAASGSRLVRLPAPAFTFTVFPSNQTLTFPPLLIPYFKFLIITFLLFFLLVSIYPSIPPPSSPPLLTPSLPPSLSRALSFAESYWSRRRLISPSLRACVMKHMRTELITAIFCRKLISRNKDPKSFFFSIIRSHFHLLLAPSNTRLIACFASKLFLYCL